MSGNTSSSSSDMIIGGSVCGDGTSGMCSSGLEVVAGMSSVRERTKGGRYSLLSVSYSSSSLIGSGLAGDSNGGGIGLSMCVASDANWSRYPGLSSVFRIGVVALIASYMKPSPMSSESGSKCPTESCLFI